MKSTLDKALVEGKSYHMQNSFSRLLEPKHDDVVDGGVDELSGAQCNHFWSGTEGLVVLTVALFCGVFARLVLKRTKIPYTVLLACLGGLLGVLHVVSYQVLNECMIVGYRANGALLSTYAPFEFSIRDNHVATFLISSLAHSFFV